MLAGLMCLVAFGATLRATRRSLGLGLGVLLVFGYMYGIARANVAEAGSHFIFDAASVGMYAGVLMRPRTPLERRKIRKIVPWFAILVGWPLVMLLIPLQDPLVQLVGFRSQVFFLPFLLIGAMLDESDVRTLVYWLCALNLVAFGFALAEYFLGVQKFFPLTDATRIIYSSNDVAGGTQLRIPSTFVASASYGGVMVLAVPWLAGAWVQKNIKGWRRLLIGAALFAAALGVFLSASRSQALILIALVLVITVTMRARLGSYVAWVIIVGVALWFVVQLPRLQRITTIRDTSYVETRIRSSANASFLEAAEAHPLGIGLGAGGTSIPYFLQDRLRNSDQIVIENEYARIMLEQGLPGFFVWVAFIAWVLTRPAPRRSDKYLLMRRLAYVAVALLLGTGIIGLGLLSWVPGTAELLLMMGWIAAPRLAPAAARARRESRPVPSHYQPAMFGR
jgi:O-Antigen ligase